MESAQLTLPVDFPEYDRLVLFGSTWKGGGEFGMLYFEKLMDFCRSYWINDRASDHFSDMAAIDFNTIIGSLFVRQFEESNLRGKTGFVSMSTGRNPRRYMPKVYIPLEAWLDQDFSTQSFKLFLADAYEKAFQEVLLRASRVKGRLLQRAMTEQRLLSFVREMREFPIETPDPDKFRMLRNKAARRGLIPIEPGVEV